MQDLYFHDQSFERKAFAQEDLVKGEYENCLFNNCDFTNTLLSSFRFTNCEFTACNLSMVSVHKTSFLGAIFKDCKMLGLRLDTCEPFGLTFSFDNCQLNHASFYKLKIRKTLFKNCQLQETDFAEADLTEVVFDNCDLLLASFDRTQLGKADFRTAYNYTIDPENNTIKKAKFAIWGIPGLLHKYDIVIEK